MALIAPVKCTHLAVRLPPLVSRRRCRFNVSATLSSPRRGDVGEVDWVKETANFFEQDPRPIMLFDGVCNLCNGGVKFVRDNDRRRLDSCPLLRLRCKRFLLILLCFVFFWMVGVGNGD